jgi:hypothetical protein
VTQYVPGPLRESLASGLPVNEAESGDLALADLRVARFFDGVIFTWHRDSSADGLAAVLDHAQRLAASAAGRRTSSPAPCAGPTRRSACSA